MDILLSGNTGTAAVSKIYKNAGNDSFSDQTGIALAGVQNSSVAWGDYDNDGDLDILLTGSWVTKIYKNNTITSNTPPSVPTNVSYNPSNNSISWSASTDSQTPSTALTYNVALGSLSSNESIISSHSLLSTGQRKLAAMGNQQHDTVMFIKGLTFGSPLYCRVQAVDHGFKGSAFSAPIQIPIYPMGSLPNDTAIVCGSTVQLDVFNVNGNADSLTYVWSLNIGLSNPNIKNPVASPTTSTLYKVIATSSSGYSFTDSILISVIPLTVNAGPDINKTCAVNLQIPATINSTNNNINYVWCPTTGLSNPNIINPIVSINSPTTYTVSAVDGACYDSDTVIINVVNPNFYIDFTVSQQVFLSPPFIVYFANLTSNISNYNFTWDFGDGTVLDTNVFNFSHTYAYNGQYSVKLTASHKTNLCQDTLLKSGFINCSGGPSIGFNSVALSELAIELYPNPNQGSFTLTISGAKAETYQIQILNVVGKVVYSESVKSSGANLQKEIQLPAMAKGLYTLSVTSENSKIVKKVMIK